MTTHLIDAQNLLCPMPVIRLQDKIKTCAHGDEVVITFTDPGAQYDVPDWCEIHAHHVLSMHFEEESNVWKIIVRVHRPMPVGN